MSWVYSAVETNFSASNSVLAVVECPSAVVVKLVRGAGSLDAAGVEATEKAVPKTGLLGGQRWKYRLLFVCFRRSHNLTKTIAAVGHRVHVAFVRIDHETGAID